MSTLVKNGHSRVGGKHRLKIYYELHGHGPNKLLFIMGLNCSSASWDYQAKYFGEHPDYQVCIFDNRGVGFSDSPYGLYSTSQMAHDAINLLDYLGWTRNIHVIGVSMGGMIAQELVLAKPQYVGSLCLTSTRSSRRTLPSLIGVITMGKLLFTRDPIQRAKIITSLLFPQEWLKAPASIDSPHRTNEERVLEDLHRRIERTRLQPVSGAIGQLAACLFHYVSSSRLQQIRNTIPHILVVTGTWDKLVNPYNSYYLAEQLGVDVVCWEGCGHALCSEQPEKYNAMLERHFKNQDYNIGNQNFN